MKIAAVIGRPVGHSKSPDLMNYMLKQTGIPGQYKRLLLPHMTLLNSFREEFNVSGVNVTAPFKAHAASLGNRLSESVRKLQAANLLVYHSGNWEADNTDVYGVEQALKHNGANVSGQSVLILGAGGAAAAATLAILQFSPAKIAVWNRSPENTRKLCAMHDLIPLKPEELSLGIQAADVVISCLPRHADFLSQLSFRPGQWVMDANYGMPCGKNRSEKQGITFIDGKDWLIFQAIPSFEKLFSTQFEPNSVDLQNMREILNTPPPKGPLFLTGFMGSGKSTIGKLLAEKLKRPFVDLDMEIERRSGMSVQTIFERQGESAFRRMETSVLAEFSRQKSAIIATGGGIVERDENRRLLGRGRTIFLWRPLDKIRRDMDSNNRPLWNPQSAEKLWQARKKMYVDSADLIVYNGSNKNELMEMLIDETY